MASTTVSKTASLGSNPGTGAKIDISRLNLAPPTRAKPKEQKIEIQCSGCGLIVDTQEKRVSLARWKMRQQGWSTTAKHENDVMADDYCPECTNETL